MPRLTKPLCPLHLTEFQKGSSFSLQERGREHSNVLYSISFYPQVALWGGCVAFAVLGGIYGYSEGFYPAPDLLWWAFLALLALRECWGYYSLPARQAWFFDDHFDVEGRVKRKGVRYSEIRQVSLKRRYFTYWVCIDLKDGTRRLEVSNPKNRRLGYLYPWLVSKTGDGGSGSTVKS